MFYLHQPDYVEWPVSVDLPSKGIKKAYKFTGYFKVLDQDEARELQDRHNELLAVTLRRMRALQNAGLGVDTDPDAIIEPLPCTPEDLADEVLCGWGDEVVDAAGEPVEFTDAAKARMYKVQGAAAAIFNAWLESIGTPTEKSAAKAGGFRQKN